VALSCIVQEAAAHNGLSFDENLTRHFILNAIRSHNNKLGPKYGEMVVCCDAGKVWRKQYFEYYKAGRKKGRDESPLDWNTIFAVLNEIRNAMQEYFPFKVIQIDGLEADDIIAVLAKHKATSPSVDPLEDMFSTSKPTMILSGDKDYAQLQIYNNVKQYSPTLKKDIVCKNPREFLLEHILRGDVGDGVPNMLSPDNIFLTEDRQSSITAPILQTWLSYNGRAEEFFDDYEAGRILPNLKRKISPDNLRKNYDRNNMMVNLDCIPQQLQQKVLDAYNAPVTGSLTEVMKYFGAAKLRNLLENVQDFRSYK